MADAAFCGVSDGAAQFVVAHLLADDRFDDFGAGDVHVAALLDHEDPVRQGRGVNGTARGGAHDGGDLRDVAGSDRVPIKDAAVTLQGRHAFLDPCAAGVVQRNERLPGAERHIHDLPDLLGMHLSKAPAGAGEVVGGCKDGPAVDQTETCDHGVGRDLFFPETEQCRTVLHKKLGLLKRSPVEEHVEPLPCGEFPEFMLLSDQLLASHFH